MKERVAIYARYSDDQQRPTSVDDQIRRCRELAKQHGLTLDNVLVFEDAAITGKAKGEARRKGFQALLEAWDAHAFSVLLVDEFSRLSRDAVTQAQLARRLEANQRVRMLTANGIDTGRPNWQLLLGLEGIVAQQAGRDTKHRVVRGMMGQLERGYMIAAPAYGYSLRRELDAAGNHLGSHWVIDEQAAAVVRDIFAWRAQGQSMHEIARQLNASAIPTCHRSRKNEADYWRPSRIRNVLSNRIYKGEFVWNGSGRSRALAKKEGRQLEQKTYQRPGLRLVSDDVWDRCNGKTVSRSGYGGGKHALAGLVSCGCCGGTLVLTSLARCRSLYCASCMVAKCVDDQRARLSSTVAAAGVQVLLLEAARFFLTPEFVSAFKNLLRARLDGGGEAELKAARVELARLERIQERLSRVLATSEEDDPVLMARYAEAREGVRSQKLRVDELVAGEQAVDRAVIEAQLQVDPAVVLDGLFDSDVAPARVRSVLARLFPEIVFEGKRSKYTSIFRVQFAPGAALAIAAVTPGVDENSVERRFVLAYSPARRGGEAKWHVDILPETRADRGATVELGQANLPSVSLNA
ncbi:recombinase family protein [Azoarcus sp. KH32C]|uniref:recombinase family protein n=1 Tax=Azoarcus sp. KH32C TaxID=748247 RepID=UPI0002385EA2|nr:recombinase family protein [Azoarcus sp. KH32C]BAL23461.1 putative site-specific recombinase [Azoarcus sp. KH32C]